MARRRGLSELPGLESADVAPGITADVQSLGVEDVVRQSTSRYTAEEIAFLKSQGLDPEAVSKVTGKNVKEFKRILRKAADEYSSVLGGELESFGIAAGGVRYPKSRGKGRDTWGQFTERKVGGEWDSFYRLHPQEQARIRTKWMSERGFSIDELQMLTRRGEIDPFARSVDEAAERFYRTTAEIDALSGYARTGRFPGQNAYHSIGSFDKLLRSTLDSSDLKQQVENLGINFDDIDIEEFYTIGRGKGGSKRQLAYLKSKAAGFTEEEAYYAGKMLEEAYSSGELGKTPVLQEGTTAEVKSMTAAERKQAAIERGKKKTSPPMTAEERRQAAIDRGAKKSGKKTSKNPVIKNSPPPGFDDDYLTDDYLASLDEVTSGSPPPIDDDYLDSFGDIFEAKVTRHEPASVIGEAVEEVGERLEPVAREVAETVAKKPMSPLEQRVKAAVIQAVDLAADISSDMSKGRSTLKTVRGEVGAVGEMLVSSQTAQNVISSMEKARGVVSGLSRNKKIGYTLGGLGAIGAVTNRSRDKRRR